jgi:hypothetical protein
MKFVDALRQEDMLTENGMATNSSSLNACVDLFFNIGAMRGQDKQRLIATFSKAFNEDPKRAMKLLFWARDVRGGAGERQVFKDIIAYLAENHDLALKPNLHLIAEYGRFDDLLVLMGTYMETQALQIIADAIKAENGLCAKWMPRKGPNAEKLRNFMKMSPKQYRKTLVNLTSVVETKMCAKEFDSIEYSKVPSVAMARYTKAFGKNDNEGFNAYIESLKKGETKINAGAVYPYDILKTMNRGSKELANEQWKSLPDFLTDSKERVLPVCDVSGSMSTAVSGETTAMDVCISLGLYISERNVGPFKDAFVTFSSRPQLQYLTGDLISRYRQLQSADWGMSTDLEATFQMVLNQAIKHKVPAHEMPTAILIMSDMEFNQAVDSRHRAIDMIRSNYEKAGYEMPKVIFWNLCSRHNNFPVQAGENNTALISGFSPSILKSVLAGEVMNPVNIMLKALNVERYAMVQ